MMDREQILSCFKISKHEIQKALFCLPQMGKRAGRKKVYSENEVTIIVREVYKMRNRPKTMPLVDLSFIVKVPEFCGKHKVVTHDKRIEKLMIDGAARHYCRNRAHIQSEARDGTK